MGIESLFPAEEYAARVEDVRTAMRAHELDALLITSPENIFYLVGLSHQGYFAVTILVFPLEGQPQLVTRSMELVTVTEQAPHVRHVGFADHEKAWVAAVRAVEDAGLDRARIGAELDSMFFPPEVWIELQERLPHVRWRNGSGVTEEIRMVKSPLELDLVRRAAALSDRAIRAGMAQAGVGVNEREVAAEVMNSMVLGGSEHPGFAPLVRSKRFLLHEHVTWRDEVLVPGDALFMELSASVGRYHAPLARMAYLGWAPHDIERSAEVSIAGIQAICGALRPGNSAGDVYSAWQAVMDDALGAGTYRRHHCGYSVGIGFPPSWVGGSTVIGLRPASPMPIRERMAFHVLSWLFDTALPDYVVSDTVIVTENGGQVVTTTRSEPIIIR